MKHFKHFNYILFYLFECFACMYYQAPHACLILTETRRHWIPDSEVTGVYGLPLGFWEFLGPLKE